MKGLQAFVDDGLRSASVKERLHFHPEGIFLLLDKHKVSQLLEHLFVLIYSTVNI